MRINDIHKIDRKKTAQVDFLDGFITDNTRLTMPSVLKIKTTKKNKFILFYIITAVIISVALPIILREVFDTQYPLASIISDSMMPTFKQGDLVFIKGVNASESPHIGEIIAWQSTVDRNFTIHRVVESDQSVIVTQGDAVSKKDPPIKLDQIVGKTAIWPEPFPWAGKPVRIPLVGNISRIVSL